MEKRLKKILIYIAVVAITVFVENICIDIFVAKTFTDDLFGFREVIVQLFQIGKLIVNAFTIYFAYIIYKMFN